MVKIDGFFGGMSGHDIKVGANQCAYAENVHLRNPEYVTLGQKTESVFATGTSLMLTGVQDDLYFAGADGKIYQKSDGSLVCTVADGGNIYNLKRVGNYYYFARILGSVKKLGRILITEAQISSDWTGEASYDDNFTTGGGLTSMQKTLARGNELLCGQDDDIYRLDNDASGTSTLKQDLGSFVGDVVGLWGYGQDTKAMTSGGQYSFVTVDGSNTLLRFPHSVAVMCGFTIDGQEFFITGHDNQYSGIYRPNGYGKELIAKATSTTNIESKEKFFFGRSTEIGTATGTTKMWGDDVVASYDGVIYSIAKNKIIARGSDYRGLPMAWDYPVVTNSAGATLTDIGFVRVIIDSGVPYLYFSREDDAGNCGVDKMKVGLTQPVLYNDSGVVYTQKFVFDGVKAGITQIQARAYTTAGQTIKVYISLDGGAYELIETLDNTDPKRYHLLNKSYEGYECQFKFVLETDDNTGTPEIRSFTFQTRLHDG